MSGEPVCVQCGTVLNAATSAEGGVFVPAAGDASLCLYCGHVAIFTGTGVELREATAAELAEVDGQPELRRARLIAAAFQAHQDAQR